jgi:predicted lipoprotein with Yx(FWY)xxD motif
MNRAIPINRERLLLTALVCLAASCGALACCAALASAHSRSRPASAHSARTATVMLRHTSVGTILTSASGATLYEFTRDRTDQDSCVKISGCSSAWPALTVSATPSAGAGVSASLLSSIRLSGGARQVTYAGHPLYLFKAGEQPGATSYVGVQEFGGSWDAVNASGHAVK